MNERAQSLDALRVASPCPASWESMRGDDRVRFCGECRLNVYNLSAMSRREAEVLVGAREGRVCVRYFQRADGTVLTQDCPVGWRKLRKQLARARARCAAAAAALCAFLLGACGQREVTRPDPVGTPSTQPAAPSTQPVRSEPPAIMGGLHAPEQPREVLGEVCGPGEPGSTK